jgi:ABC-type nitrate/sulfonate/bicarbonate transport system substrate-binding protein
LAAATAVVVLSAAGCGSSGQQAAASSGVSSGLITIGTSFKTNSAAIYIADKAGYFKDAGLNVKVIDTSALSSSDFTSAFFGGSYDFINAPAPTAMIADASAGSNRMTAVMQMDLGSHDQIALSKSAAASAHLPASDGSAATSLTQLKDLKAAHITTAVTSLTSIAYIDLVAACSANGVTCKPNSTGANVDVVTVGSPGTQVAGLAAGKFSSIVAGPPTTTQPGATTIDLGEIAPVSTAVNDYLIASPTFVAQNAGTVQAVVNAISRAWAWAQSHPAQAEQLCQPMYKETGVTSAAEMQQLYSGAAQYWGDPTPSQAPFQATEQLANFAQPSKLKLTFAQFANPAFEAKAEASYKVQVPSQASSPASSPTSSGQ